MELKTIIRLCVVAAVVIAAVLFVGGIIGRGNMTYQLPGPYTAERSNSFSTVQVAMTVKDDKIVDAFIHADGVQTTMFDKDIPDGALYFKIRPEGESDYDTAVSFFCRNNEGGDEK